MIRAALLVLAILAALALGGCGPLSGALVKGALGSGPKIAANGQAGQSNAQVLGAARISNQHMLRPQARSIEQSAAATGARAEQVGTLVQNSGAPWSMVYALLAACLVFWALPDPGRLAAQVRGVFSRSTERRP